jgi:hypothetical protein
MRRMSHAAVRVPFALVVGAALSLVTWVHAGTLLQWHNGVVRTLSPLAAVEPIPGGTFSLAGRTLDALTVREPPGAPGLGWMVLAIVAPVLVLIGRRFPLLRGAVAFALVILLATAVRVLIGPAEGLSVHAYARLWAQTAVIVWTILPLLTSLLFLVGQPSFGWGLGWMVLVQTFAIASSALRAVTFLGVAQHTGVLLLPTLWFVAGILADFLFVTAFYGMAIHVALTRLEPRRAAWA